MNEMIKRWTAYFLSLCVITIIYVYLLNLPEFISQSPDLVIEYYHKQAITSFVLDIFLIAAYISVAMYVGKLLKIKQEDHVQQLLALIVTILAISGAFMAYFNMGGSPGTFFSKWFKRVGYKAIVYDVIFICSIYILMLVFYNSKIFKRL